MGKIVDIVMPVYNAAPYLKESMESILQQTFSDFQFIVIDDGSTDGSWDILQQYAKEDSRIVLLRNTQNSGICISLNKAIHKSAGKYIIRMDADDIAHKERIEKQLDFMENNHDVGVCGCNMRCIDCAGNIISQKTYPIDDVDIRKKLFLFNAISHSGAIIRRSVFEKTDGYSNIFILAEDLDLWFALGSQSHFANLPIELMDYRIYDQNSTSSKLKKMITQSIKVRMRAIFFYKYNPGILGSLAIMFSFCIQLLPSNLIHRLFYTLRSFVE